MSLLLALLILARAPTPEPSGVTDDGVVDAESTIRGTVRVAGSLEPIPSASIELPELQRAVLADRKGYFVVTDVPPGRWTIEASAPGYAANTVTIESDGSGVVRLDFELEIQPIALETVEVETEPASAEAMTSAPGAAGPPAARLDGPTLKFVPGLVEADVLRSLQLLPAVAAISDYSSALYVRGGSADQNLIALDGVPLFNPYHVGGIFSAIGADAVSTVDLWAGAFPARTGDRVSSIVDIRTRDGGYDEVRTSGAMGLLSAHATVDGPLPGDNGVFLFTGRRTYLDLASRAADAVGIIPITIPYGFSDAYFKATRSVGALGSVTISAYIDGESFRPQGELRDDLDGEMDFGWGSRMLAASWRQPFAGNLLLEARAAYSGFRGDFHASEYRGEVTECNEIGCREIAPPTDTVPTVRARTRIHDLLAGVDLSWFHATHTLRAGAHFDAYRFDHSLDVIEEVDEDRIVPFSQTNRPRTLAAYVEDEWSPSASLRLRAGLRVLGAGAHGTAWMPRLGARWQATPSLTLSFGSGLYAQVMRTMRNDESAASSFIAYDLLTAQPPEVGLARAADIVIGAEWSRPSTRLRLEGYTRRFSNLIVPSEAADPIDAPVLITDEYAVAKGSTIGLELMASHQVGNATLGLSYALTFAERTTRDETFPPRFERRHLVDASGTLRLGRSGVLSTRLALGTGQPYTPIIGFTPGVRYDPVTDAWSRLRSTPIRGDHNRARLPGYLRLDIAARKSFDKRWFGQDGSLTPYIQILNVLNTRNALVADVGGGFPGELTYLPQLPFLPTFGVEWRF